MNFYEVIRVLFEKLSFVTQKFNFRSHVDVIDVILSDSHVDVIDVILTVMLMSLMSFSQSC